MPQALLVHTEPLIQALSIQTRTPGHIIRIDFDVIFVVDILGKLLDRPIMEFRCKAKTACIAQMVVDQSPGTWQINAILFDTRLIEIDGIEKNSRDTTNLTSTLFEADSTATPAGSVLTSALQRTSPANCETRCDQAC